MNLALTLPQPSITYVYGHVEVIGFKGVSHLARGALTLLKPKGEHVTKVEAKRWRIPKS